MASNTPNLDLLKKDPVTDGNDTFNIETMLNENWDKIDAAVGQLEEDMQEIDIPLSDETNGTRSNVAGSEKAVGLVMQAANAANLAAATAQTRADQAFTAGNERKAEVVAALVALGVSASTSDSWDTLISKMSAIIKATGNATAADVLAGKTFSNANGNGLIGTAIGRIITPFIWVGNDGPSYSMPPAGPIEGIPMVESGKTSGSLTKTTSPSVISIFTGSPSFGNSYINCASNIAVDLTFVDYVRIIGKHRRSTGSNDGGNPTNSYFVLGVANTKSARASAFASKETIHSTNTDFLPFERVIDVRSLNGQYYVKIELLVGNWVDLYEYVNLDEIALIRSKNN
ncbi:hypothetical protein J41TS12_10530 [Paenibacillus antibioticophila]|uniref:Tail fiber-like repeat protein n=1 Tax=Paenibacillus antibioticophila TaxID=1274374 RepID=A0A920CGY6_9BACL|nr:hypothetical protein [Paenibacillus antibioticophila]GIO36192.1 hypothetical protein J41TS12_10530 [Paenibacillus antibioticophila]